MGERWTLVRAFGAVAAVLCLAWVGQSASISANGRRSSVSPARIITQRVAKLAVGKPQSYGSLTIFPITGESIVGLDYMTLDEAMREKAVEITESGSGSVNEVVIRNKSGKRVFIMDGEEIVGAKQNRVLNTSVLIGPEQVAKIPVSCVEHGRWVGQSMSFRSGGTQLFARARQANVAAVNGNFAASPKAGAQSDQSRIWSDVARKRANLSVGEGSGPMHEAYAKYHGDIDDYVKAFHTAPGQVGAVCAINGEIVGVDTFDQSRTLERLFTKLVKSYALDAIEVRRGAAVQTTARALTQRSAEEFLRLVLLKGVEFNDCDSPGEGRDVRITSKSIQGSSLLAAARPVHIALFAPPDKEPTPAHPANIRPPSQRRLR